MHFVVDEYKCIEETLQWSTYELPMIDDLPYQSVFNDGTKQDGNHIPHPGQKK